MSRRWAQLKDALRASREEVKRLRQKTTLLQEQFHQRPVEVEIIPPNHDPPHLVTDWRADAWSRYVNSETIKVKLTDETGRVFTLSPSTVDVYTPPLEIAIW